MNKSKSVAESLNAVVKTHLVTMSEQYNVYAKAILEMEDKIRALKQIMLSQDFLNNIQSVNLVTGGGESACRNTNKSNKTNAKKENRIVSDVSVDSGIATATATETETETDVSCESPKLSFFSPQQKNSLFWCFYIIVNGLSGYEYEKNYFTAEQEFKVKIIERIKKGENKQILKEHKMSKNMIESGLMGTGNMTGISPKTLYALSLFHNVNIFYVYKNTYYEMFVDANANVSDSKIHIIQFNPDNNCYSVCVYTNANEDEGQMEYIENIKKTCLKLDNLDDVNKPLRPISSYSLTELLNIAEKMNISDVHDVDTNINTNKKINVKRKTKNELYTEIMEKCV
jgi:hypothetical protein